MTPEEKAHLLGVCSKIKANSNSIFVKENFNNSGFRSYSLTELPTEIAINYAIKFVEDRINALVVSTHEENLSITETK